MALRLVRFPWILVMAAAFGSAPAQAFFVDGEGHYGLRGETQTAPAFSKNTGTYQAIEQSLRIKGEARFNDLSSMYLEFRLFDNPREAYLGDKAEPRDCAASQTGEGQGAGDPCEGEHQNTAEPGYQPYTPKVTQAYMRYAFDYCILEAGRRGRDWGLGIFLDSGSDPFETDASIYDGVTCNVNIQKTQTLGFSVGYDKLAETGAYVDPPADEAERTRRFGANDSNDDVDQYFFTIEYDDRKANAGAPFTKQIGVYFSQINSRSVGDGGANTDLKFLDLYTGFYLGDLAFKNEILFRMGKSADPNWQLMGGKRYEDSEPVTNKMDSIALAGALEWTLSHSGAAMGPAEYNKGDYSRHLLFFNYAYAPGDKHGYFGDKRTGAVETDGISDENRDTQVTAMAFHRNYKPALLLFNSRPEADRYIEDGAFNPSRVLNASVLGLGYKYESLQTGDFEVKLVTANLIQGVPQEVKTFYDRIEDDPAANDDGERPAGYYGKSLGYELDLSYAYKVGREADLGVAAAAALPGDGWKVDKDSKPTNNFLVRSYVAFKF